MYVDAFRSGMVADMGTERWTTLCAIASFMNEKGECYPTQDHIARLIGVSRQTANKYVKSLLEYRWKGKALITSHRLRDDKTGKWENNRYTISPVSNLTIFNADVISMSTFTDNVFTDNVNVDTKKIH
jgi:hypothetical protein